jgi:protein O-GlcNAc transferase
MQTVFEALQRAVGLHQAGRLEEAEQVYRMVLTVDSRNPDAWHLLGVLAHQKGNFDVAVENIERAIAVNPIVADAHVNLGNAYRGRGDISKATSCYLRALEIDPRCVEALFNLGNQRNAERSWYKAIEFYRQALAFNPQHAGVHCNLGAALQSLGRWEEATEAYQRAVAIQPAYDDAYFNWGTLLFEQGKKDEAIQCLRKVIETNPDYAEAYFNLGNALRNYEQLDESIAIYEQALKLKPNYGKAEINLAVALLDAGRVVEAVGHFQRAIDLEPQEPLAQSKLAFAVMFCPGYDVAAIFEEARKFNERYAASLAQFSQPHVNDRSPDRRLKIGYVSPEFRQHSQSFFTIPLFAAHDHAKCEIYCYSDVVRPDTETERIRTYADVWRDVAGMTDEQLAEQIRQDGIDILVDLTLHMEGNRLLMFARKPAPVQVCWLAYPGTTGLTAMDYRLTDRYLDPQGEFDAFCSEKSIRLPDAFWCYDPLTDQPAVGPLPATKNEFITFGSLNSFSKMNEGVLALWGRVMAAVTESRLLMLAPDGSARERVLDALARFGIGRERVTFVGLQPRAKYLELYQQIDIGVDTIPANGHTTSLDALWMGVPVVTLVGQTAIGRGGISILQNLGLPELIAQTPEQYVEIVSHLAREWDRLAGLRQTLRGKLKQSPLMDAERFARGIEAAYREMWREWCGRG